MNNDLVGFINIYKEKGYTSHDVVNIVRKQLDRIKTGHTGTLDPDAEGVLPICIGKATKLAGQIAADIKEYRAEITLGITTTTEDISGDIIEQKNVDVSEDSVIKTIESFIGEYEQIPPMYSAIKINGKKLYELAREGKEVERKTRLVNIYDISGINKKEYNKYIFTVLCSKGTYIRTLCSDIGKKLGCGGCMSDLVRTRSGSFYIEDSIKLDEFKSAVANGLVKDIISDVESVLGDHTKVTVSEKAHKYLYNGNKIHLNYIDKVVREGEKLRVYDENDRLIGIYRVNDGYIKPVTMLI